MNSKFALSTMRASFLGSYHREGSDFRANVAAFESEMLKLPQVKLPLIHHFAPGIYMRELHIPAGVTSTGKIHKYEHVGILTKGVRTMLIDGVPRTITAPYTATIKAGSKLACYTWEDSIYVTIHPNPDDERDIPTLEARYVCDTEQEYLAYVAASQKVIECHS